MSTRQMAGTRAPERTTEHSAERRPGPAWLAVAGIVGPILFTAAFLVQGLFRLDEYSPMAEPVSALEAGPGGWVQQVNFLVFGLLTMAFAVGLHLGVRPTRAGILGPAILVVSAVGLLLAAIFPLTEDSSGVTVWSGGHVVAGVTFFLGSAVGLIVLSRRLARDPAWRSLSTYSLTAGVAAVVGFLAMGMLVQPDDAALHQWAGLAQRVLIIAILFPCFVTLGIRLLRITKEIAR